VTVRSTVNLQLFRDSEADPKHQFKMANDWLREYVGRAARRGPSHPFVRVQNKMWRPALSHPCVGARNRPFWVKQVNHVAKVSTSATGKFPVSLRLVENGLRWRRMTFQDRRDPGKSLYTISHFPGRSAAATWAWHTRDAIGSRLVCGK
jgi:hypothetical protein